MLLLEMFILLTENILILTSLSFFLLEEVMRQNNSHYVFQMLGDMAVDFNYVSSFFIFFLILSQSYWVNESEQMFSTVMYIASISIE